jgi:hypothetical protein
MKFLGITLGLAVLVAAEFKDIAVGDALEDCLIKDCPT